MPTRQGAADGSCPTDSLLGAHVESIKGLGVDVMNELYKSAAIRPRKCEFEAECPSRKAVF